VRVGRSEQITGGGEEAWRRCCRDRRLVEAERCHLRKGFGRSSRLPDRSRCRAAPSARRYHRPMRMRRCPEKAGQRQGVSCWTPRPFARTVTVSSRRQDRDTLACVRACQTRVGRGRPRRCRLPSRSARDRRSRTGVACQLDRGFSDAFGRAIIRNARAQKQDPRLAALLAGSMSARRTA